MKRYLVVIDYQIEEDQEPPNQSSVWHWNKTTAKEYFDHYYLQYVKREKAGACSMYQFDWDRDTGILTNQVVMEHKYNKFKKIVRYNAEKKAIA